MRTAAPEIALPSRPKINTVLFHRLGLLSMLDRTISESEKTQERVPNTEFGKSHEWGHESMNALAREAIRIHGPLTLFAQEAEYQDWLRKLTWRKPAISQPKLTDVRHGSDVNQ